jgi:hypothetical protein
VDGCICVDPPERGTLAEEPILLRGEVDEEVEGGDVEVGGCFVDEGVVGRGGGREGRMKP